MALTYGFYNSVNGDRRYDALQMGKLFDGIIQDGVFNSIGDNFAVTANSGMNIFVGTGKAWFNHTWTLNDTLMSLTVEESHPVYSRIDAVVLEVDASSTTRENTIKIVKGESASEPVRPEMIHTDYVNQYPLAYITVGRNVTEILTSDIQNVVGLEEEGTPFVTGLLEVNSIDYLYAMWDSEFNNWFNAVRYTVLDTTLPAGDEVVTVTSPAIRDGGLIDIYTSKYGVNPTSVTISEGEAILTFEAQEEDITVGIRCW